MRKEESSKMFVPLICINEWGLLRWVLGPSTGNRVKDSQLPQAVFSEGQEVRIRWPDGKTDIYSIAYRHHVYHINDMGHGYIVNNNIPGFKVDVNGLSVWVDLDQVEIEL